MRSSPLETVLSFVQARVIYFGATELTGVFCRRDDGL